MRALDLATSVPWAIRQESLQQILDIAARIHEPDFEAAATRLAERNREIDLGAVSVSPGKPLQGATSARMRGSVAVLPVTGPIFRYATMFSAISGATSIEMLARDLRVALNDPDVEAILLHIDSPGGEVNGTGEFAEMIYAARGSKPIWAYVSNEGASAAYWIASSADRVICAPTALLGSIGVVAAVPDPSVENRGRVQFVSSQSPDKRPDPTTKGGKDKIQSMIDDLAAQFVNTVARNRDVTVEHVVSDFGGGWVLVGQKAVDAGLADSIGSYEQALSDIVLRQQRGNSTSRTDTKGVSQPSDTSSAALPPTNDNEALVPKSLVSAARGSDENHEEPRDIAERGNRHMSSFRDRFKAWMSGGDDAELEAEFEAPTPATPPAVPTPVAPAMTTVQLTAVEMENRQLRDNLAKTQDNLRRIKEERMSETAQHFADSLVEAGRIVPAESAGVVKNHIQAAVDDELIPLQDGNTRVKNYENSLLARPKHMLSAEAVPAALNDVMILRNSQQSTTKATPAGQKMSAERKAELMRMTDLGQQVSQANGKN